MPLGKPITSPGSAEAEEDGPSRRERLRAVLSSPLFTSLLCGFIAAGTVALAARSCELHIPEPLQRLMAKADEPRPAPPPPVERLPPRPAYVPLTQYVQEPAPPIPPPPKPKPPAQRCVTVNTFKICK